MSPFQYKARSDDSWKKRETQSGSNYAGFILDEFKTFTAKKQNWIRILPPTWDNPQHYGMDLWVHYSVGPDNGSVICLAKMRGTACPICEAHARAEASGREDAYNLKPTRRVAIYVIDRNEEGKKDVEKKPLVWAMPWTLDRDISKVCRDRQTGELYQIDHPDAGFDVTFDVEGERPNIKYVGVQIARRPSTVDKEYLDFIEKNPVSTTFQWRTYEEVKALFEGQGVMESQKQEQASASAPPTQAPPVEQFVSQWTALHCSICNELQYTTLTGVTCISGHVDAKSVEEIEEETKKQDAPPPSKPAPPPPPPPPPAAAAAASSGPPAGLFANPTPTNASPQPAASAPQSRAAGLRARFTK